MTPELMSVEEYAGFISVKPRTVRRWIAAGFIWAVDIEPDGRLFREGASLDLLARLATPMAARIAFLELTIVDEKVRQAVDAFQQWSVNYPRGWRALADGRQYAEAVSGNVAGAADLKRYFAFFHLDPGAAERRALLRTPCPEIVAPEPFNADRFMWEIRHPVIDEETRATLRAWARKAERRARQQGRDVVPLDDAKFPRLVPIR
jgi:hypothetical protein